MHRLIGAEDAAADKRGQQAVGDLTGRAGDSDLDRRLGWWRHRHVMKLLRTVKLGPSACTSTLTSDGLTAPRQPCQANASDACARITSVVSERAAAARPRDKPTALRRGAPSPRCAEGETRCLLGRPYMHIVADRPMRATRRERQEKRHQRDRAHGQKTPKRYATVRTN